MTRYAVDTSVAVPLLASNHPAYQQILDWSLGKDLCFSGHALAETYSVLTRLPGNLRVAPNDVVHLLESNFMDPVLPKPQTATGLPALLAPLGIQGGGIWDALVGLAAVDNGLPLATRDARAIPTYDALGVVTEVLG